MTTRKPQNSILVLATLGVYLGLVLAGATPQVLAQAAMARQFDVKDEIEVSENLDKKPDSSAAEPSSSPSAETDGHITRSVERFLANFKTVDSLTSLCEMPAPAIGREAFRSSSAKNDLSANRSTHSPLAYIVVLTNFARADLGPLLAKDVK